MNTMNHPFTNRDEEFRCRIYRKSSLARLYFPTAKRPTALRALRRWIGRCRPLSKALAEIGYDKHRQSFLRSEVALIVDFLGEP